MHQGNRTEYVTGFIVALLLWIGCASAAGSVIYVSNSAGSDAYDGLSWATAKATIGAGIRAAASGGQIWVAHGKYGECITLKVGVALYGGFAGTESQLSDRPNVAKFTSDPNQTIINGDNCGSVVTCPPGATSTTIIDGFTITGGNGTPLGSIRVGGGIYCAGSSPTISNNILIDNNATKGAGIYCSGSSPTIIANSIKENCVNSFIKQPCSVMVLRGDANYVSHYSVMFQYCKKRNIPLLIALNSNFGVGGPGQLTNAMIREMADSGLVTFCSHTHSHPGLSLITEPEFASHPNLRRRKPFGYTIGNAYIVALVTSQSEMLALGASPGRVCYRADQNVYYRLTESPADNVSNWQALSSDDAHAVLKQKFTDEFVLSKQWIEAKSGQPCTGMIYPANAIKNDGITEALADGYTWGGTVSVPTTYDESVASGDPADRTGIPNPDLRNVPTVPDIKYLWMAPQQDMPTNRFLASSVGVWNYNGDWNQYVVAPLRGADSLCYWGHLYFHSTDGSPSGDGAICPADRFSAIMDYAIDQCNIQFVSIDQFNRMAFTNEHPFMSGPVSANSIYTQGYNFVYNGHMRWTYLQNGANFLRPVSGKWEGWYGPSSSIAPSCAYFPPTDANAPISLVDGRPCGCIKIPLLPSYDTYTNYVRISSVGADSNAKLKVRICFQAKNADSASQIKVIVRVFSQLNPNVKYGDPTRWVTGVNLLDSDPLGSVTDQWKTFTYDVSIPAGAYLAVMASPTTPGTCYVSDLQAYKIQ